LGWGVTAIRMLALRIWIDSPELRQLVADYHYCISRLDSLIGELHPDFKKIDKEMPFVKAVVAQSPE